MTREQRRRHLVIWAAVLPLSALIVVLGWFGRSEFPDQDQISRPDMQQVPDGGYEDAP